MTDEWDEFPKFGDFAEEPGTLEGDKLKLDDILNQEILIVGHRISQSKYDRNESGKYLAMQYHVRGRDGMNVTFTGSDVLIRQMEKYADRVPFMTVIRKKNRHYEMT